MHLVVYRSLTLSKGALVNFYRNLMYLTMLYVKPVPDVDILFTIVTVYLSVFFSHSRCLPVSGEIKLYIC